MGDFVTQGVDKWRNQRGKQKWHQPAMAAADTVAETAAASRGSDDGITMGNWRVSSSKLLQRRTDAVTAALVS